MEKKSARSKDFNIILYEGQYVAGIINCYGQFLLFSGEPFFIGKSESEEAVKVFNSYEEAVDFAGKIVLPAKAKTYCIFDYKWKCIKSGTGDEEREYDVIARKLVSAKNSRKTVLQKIMAVVFGKKFKK